MADQNKHLYYINEIPDYKISEGYPDVRGWDVKDIDNRMIGKVDNLLVNKESERVVYLDVEVDKSIIDAKYDPYAGPNQSEFREFVNKDGENHIIIPIGLVDFNEDSNYVYTDIIDHRTFSETKRYRKGADINRSYEDQVLGSYVREDDAKNRDFNLLKDENRFREIIRDEIRKYHHDTEKDKSYGSSEAFPQSTRADDAFYERREFDDERFKKRTPGL